LKSHLHVSIITIAKWNFHNKHYQSKELLQAGSFDAMSSLIADICTMMDGSPQDKPREMESEFESNFERDKAELIFANGKGDKAKKDKDSKINEMLCAPSPNLSTVAEKIQTTNYAADTDLYPEDQEFALEEEVLIEGRELTLEDFKKLEVQSQEISLPGQICMRRSRSSTRTRGGDRVHRIESRCP
jgi:hypothetical protein